MVAAPPVWEGIGRGLILAGMAYYRRLLFFALIQSVYKNISAESLCQRLQSLRHPS